MATCREIGMHLGSSHFQGNDGTMYSKNLLIDSIDIFAIIMDYIKIISLIPSY